MIETSILIPAKDEGLNIRTCLDAVFSQKTGTEFEVILVDSGSTDGIPEIVSGYPVGLYRIAPGTNYKIPESVSPNSFLNAQHAR
jgi:glycosyltransferase involved in cell wall biosynthesis